jgi:SAM-dependent methyltransferase
VSALQPNPYEEPELYDLIYAWYRVDVDFYVERAKAAGGPVLEAACGTGRILLPTAQAGVDIDGFDLNPRMLDGLRRKAAALGLAPRVAQGDLRDFTMPRRYTLITIPFRAFMHLMETEDQIRALRCLREHLEPGGTLLFNLFYPCVDFMARRAGRRLQDEHLLDPSGRRDVVSYSTTRYDHARQRMVTEREVLAADGAVLGHYAFALRWTYRWEMELLLRAAGFQRWDVRGGFDGRPLESDRDEMVWTAWKD